MNIPKWQSHKIVEAFWIGRIEGLRLYCLGDESVYVDVSLEYINKHPLNEAGYYVRYEGGYESWSPVHDFEKGYTRTLSDIASGLNFGQALEALKKGLKVARAGWNGKGMWLTLIRPGNAMHLGLDMQPCIGMKTASPRGEIQPGWNASQSDMLAEDWEVVAP